MDNPQDYPYRPGSMPPPPAFFPMPVKMLRVGFGKRFGSYLVDVIVSGLLCCAFAFFLNDIDLPGKEMLLTRASDQMGANSPIPEQFLSYGVTFAIVAPIVGLLYSLVELLTAASPAKHMLAITVAAANGAVADRLMLLKRWAVKTSPTLLGVLAMIAGHNQALETASQILTWGFVAGCFIAIGSERRAMHDYVAGTAVFHKDDVPVAASAPQPLQ